MREKIALRAALGTGAVVVLAVVLFADLRERDAGGDPAIVAGTPPTHTAVDLPQRGPSAPAGAAAPLAAADTLLARGERVYREQQCGACHSIAGVGSPRSPLDGVGSRLTADRIRLWIVDPQAARPGIRKPAYDDLPPADLEALVAYMQSLR
jgi:mono/diheme cytochrome c family protein